MKYRGSDIGFAGDVGLSAVMSGGTTLMAPSCAVDVGSRNIVVAFHRAPLKNFRGVGSTTGDKRFDIRMNCSTQGSVPHSVQLRFDAAADSSGAPGVLRLSPGSHSAQGVGIRLLEAGNGAPVPLGESIYVGPSMDGSYVASFVAQYFQTQEVVKPGRADGITSFTITYR